jgi:hypothetical protein
MLTENGWTSISETTLQFWKQPFRWSIKNRDKHIAVTKSTQNGIE